MIIAFNKNVCLPVVKLNIGLSFFWVKLLNPYSRGFKMLGPHLSSFIWDIGPHQIVMYPLQSKVFLNKVLNQSSDMMTTNFLRSWTYNEMDPTFVASYSAAGFILIFKSFEKSFPLLLFENKLLLHMAHWQ